MNSVVVYNGDMETLIKQFHKDHFAIGMGTKILQVKPGYAQCSLDVEPRHHNSLGTIQGGALFTLADFAFALASNAHGRIAVGLHADIAFVKPISEGTILAEAKEDTLGYRTGNYTVTVTAKETGITLAIFHGLAYRKDEPVPGLQ